jgi:hypothetical protein
MTIVNTNVLSLRYTYFAELEDEIFGIENLRVNL